MRIWIGISILFIAVTTTAQERRAPAPTFRPEQVQGIFFDKLSDAIRGERPSMASLRGSKTLEVGVESNSPGQPSGTDNRWSQLIGPTALEDEVKRIKLHFDSVITTPTAFNSGGFKEARLDLSVLATLFAVINEHGDDVRWKEYAVTARDLVARTAFNCKAGSNQVYNEAKLRKADLQDLLSGSGLATREAEANDDWSSIADRVPLMAYSESLIESLEAATNVTDTSQRNVDLIKRNAQLIAMLGEVLSQAGMDDASDDDYVKLSQAMSRAANELVSAVERSAVGEYQSAVGSIRKRCDACHEQYR